MRAQYNYYILNNFLKKKTTISLISSNIQSTPNCLINIFYSWFVQIRINVSLIGLLSVLSYLFSLQFGGFVKESTSFVLQRFPTSEFC